MGSFVLGLTSATTDDRTAVTQNPPPPKPYEITLTAYVPDPGSKTATGKDANAGPGLAADFSVFPAGTKVLIPGKGTLTVDDTGGFRHTDPLRGIRGHLDLRIIPRYRPNKNPNVAYQQAIDQANAIGRRRIIVYVYPPPSRQTRG